MSTNKGEKAEQSKNKTKTSEVGKPRSQNTALLESQGTRESWGRERVVNLGKEIHWN